MRLGRVAGVLLHPTGFPSAFGIGDLGPVARNFVDWLAKAEQRVWQVLPLGPIDQYGSPYRSPSAFAGNPLLISPEELAQEGLITLTELEAAKISASNESLPVDFAEVTRRKRHLLENAYRGFKNNGGVSILRDEFSVFCSRHADWLNEYATFMAYSDVHQTSEWPLWTECEVPLRQPADSRKHPQSDALKSFSDVEGFHCFVQFIFFRQWQDLRKHAHQRGICIFGDIPIYVSGQSADVWSNPELFELDDSGRPTRVAGVPPDYFSSTGQLWHNPLYNWKAMRSEGYSWWVRRMKVVLELVDVVRLDHFRGFHAYWVVAAGEDTAVDGQWVEGPGEELFEALQRNLAAGDSWAGFSDGRLPIIAEDLGVITPDVNRLRQQFDMPGMSVMQFAFGRGAEDRFLPENVKVDSIAYTGTHDNDTTMGWFQKEIQGDPKALSRLGQYIPSVPGEVAWEMIDLVWRTRAAVAIAPLQDIFSLGSESRMNTPGKTSGNWRWRFEAGRLTPDLQERLAAVTRQAGRASPTF